MISNNLFWEKMVSFLLTLFPNFPRDLGDRVALGFLCLMLPLVAAFEIFFIIPSVYHDNPFNHGLHIFFISWVWFNIYHNLVLILRINVSTKNRVLPAILKPGWRFCSMCNTNSPPRSYHCVHCDLCILKRDHHCVFTGGCVGFHNHRYYIGLIIYLWIATFYANVMNFDFVWEELGSLGLKVIIAVGLPLVAWLMSLVPHFSFLVAAITAVVGISFVWLTTLIAFHGKLILLNQTTHEGREKSRKYDLGRLSNLETALGSCWRFAWISPFVPSPLLGDGFEFPTKEFVGLRDSIKGV